MEMSKQPYASRETKFSAMNGDGGKVFFSVQLGTSTIGNLTWLIHTLAICDEHILFII